MNRKTVLVVSIALNFLLLGTVGYLAKNRPTADTPVVIARTNTPVAPLPPEKEAAPATVTKRVVQTLDWRAVESEDYKKYIANLRSIGCPEETIRDIITADVNKLYAAHRRELPGNTNKFEFWKSGNPFAAAMDPERIQKQQEWAKEKRALLKELLGADPEEKPDLFAGMNPFESVLDFLSPKKQNDVMDVFMKYQAKMAKTFSRGAPDSDDQKQMRNTQKEMEAELAKILSPQELEDYQLRMSQTAMSMRMQLASFEPTEKEFRDIFKLKKNFDDDYGGPFGERNLDKGEREKRTAAKKVLDTQLKDMLGESRFTEYERAQDWAYQGIFRVTERFDLPKDAAVKVYDMKKAAEGEAKKVRDDKSLSSEQRQASLQGIRTETEGAIKKVFGDKGWESYQKQQGAYWLRGISPDPKSE